MKKIVLFLLICMMVVLASCNSGEPYAKCDEDTIKDMHQDKYDREEKWMDEENIKIYKRDELCFFKDGKKIHIGMDKKALEKIIGKPIKEGSVSNENQKYNIFSSEYIFADETEVTYEASSGDYNKLENETLTGIYITSPNYVDCAGISVGDSKEKVTQILFEKYGEECVDTWEKYDAYMIWWNYKGEVKKNEDKTLYNVGVIGYKFSDGILERMALSVGN